MNWLGWRVRSFASANVVVVGDRMIILEEDGHLALATPSPDGLTVHSKVRLMKAPSRTVPTIVGRTMFVRDFPNIMALDLG